MKKITQILVLLITSLVLVACTPGASAGVDIQKVHEQVKEDLGEAYIPSMELGMDELVNLTEIDPELIENFVAEVPMMSTHIDTFIAIQAVEGKGEEVEATLEEYYAFLNDSILNYPMNLAKVKTAKVTRHGDYVFFTMLGDFDSVNDTESAAGLDFAEKQNQRAVDSINTFFTE